VLAALDVLTGLTLLLAGAVAWRGRPRSRVGLLQVVAAACWFAGGVIGALAFVHRGPLVQLHVSYPTGRLHRRLAGAVVLLAWGVGLLEGLRPVPGLTLLLGALVTVAALDIYLRSSGNARQAGGPALVSALMFAAVLAASSVNRLLDLRLDDTLAISYDAVVILVAAWLTLDLLTGRWTEATVADLVTQLGGEPDARGVQSALRSALGDPTLVVGYHTPEHATYVDEDGRPLDVRPSGDQVVTAVEDAGSPVAVLVHAATALDDPELMKAAVAAVRLAVGNASLRARVQQQMDELSTTRRRLVEAADRERAAIASRLDAGADRHLARVDTLLATLPASELRKELAEARRDLRDLASGVRARELEPGGLPGAVAALAERSPVPAATDVVVGRLAPAVESALYFVCAEALTNAAKHARATTVRIRAEERDGHAVLTVSDDGDGGADPAGSGLRGLADRVEALGGTLEVDSGAARGTTVAARLPIVREDGL
jgi:signal transduction histidine kinase